MWHGQKENNVTLITEKEMEIIQDKRNKEKEIKLKWSNIFILDCFYILGILS